MDLRAALCAHQDLQYKAFHQRIVNNIDPDTIIGVRLPILRKLAAQSLKEPTDNPCEYYEEIMVKGLAIGMKKCSLEEHLADLREYIPLINNWALCDSPCAAFKFTKQYQAEMFDFILSYLDGSEYETRFAIVMLMDYYLDDNYIHRVLDILANIHREEYYVNMAVAWALSVAYVKYLVETERLLKQQQLSADVQNKAIQKINDSFRVDKVAKQNLKQYKIT